MRSRSRGANWEKVTYTENFLISESSLIRLRKRNNVGNIYEEYASLDAQIAALEAKKDQLRPHILKMMIEQGQKMVDTAVGKFSVSKRKVWTYPERITELKESVKAEEAKAQSTGEATFEEVDSLRFTQVKL